MLAVLSRIRIRPRQVVSVVFFLLIASLAQMVIPTLVSIMIDDGISGNNMTLIIVLAIIMIGLSVFACMMSVMATKISASITTQFSADLRKEIYHKVQGFSAWACLRR